MASTREGYSPIGYNITKREQLELLRQQLINERSSFMTHWRELGDYVLPRRPRFTLSDTNKGEKRSQKIIDSTATLAMRTLRSGMMSGITSPARPWFRLTTPDPELAEFGPVKEWLHFVGNRMATIFLRSNVYNVLPTIYGDIGTFATGCMFMEEDFDEVVRFYPFPVGSYMIANDEMLRVRVFMREFRMTVRQLISKFGKQRDGTIDWSKFSTQVRSLWDQAHYEAWIDVIHVVQPNEMYEPSQIQSKYKKFYSCYYERGYSGTAGSSYYNSEDERRFLSEGGFDNFPILAPRWETTGEDTYGTDCPGMSALGDIKALQTMHKRKAQAIDKMVNPPMVGPTNLKTTKTSILPGDLTYTDERDGTKGFRPAHLVDPRILEVRQDIIEHQDRIRRACYEDLFLMLANTDRRQITAREIDERHEEKLLALGPVLEQLNQDLLDPLIDNTFAIMLKQGLIPPPPEELDGVELKVEYISVMAQAQKLVGLGGLERFTGFVGQLISVTQDPSHMDKVNVDQLIDEYGEGAGLPPKVIRTDEEVAEIKQSRAQAQEQQAQAERASQVVPAMAGAAKQLSETQTQGGSALDQLLAQAEAGGLTETV